MCSHGFPRVYSQNRLALTHSGTLRLNFAPASGSAFIRHFPLGPGVSRLEGFNP